MLNYTGRGQRARERDHNNCISNAGTGSFGHVSCHEPGHD
jgi:hypothetical protein